MSETVEFFFDVGSPYSYMASTQIGDLIERTGAEVEWRPFLLGGVFKATGNDMPAALEPKAEYMLADLHRWAEHYDVPFQMNSGFPVNTLLAQRAIHAAEELTPGTTAQIAMSLFRAVWAEDRDVSKPEVVAQVASEAGLDGEDIVAMSQQQQIKDRLRAESDEAVDRGAFGAPTFFVGEAMFWGNDRLQFVEAELQS